MDRYDTVFRERLVDAASSASDVDAAAAATRNALSGVDPDRPGNPGPAPCHVVSGLLVRVRV